MLKKQLKSTLGTISTITQKQTLVLEMMFGKVGGLHLTKSPPGNLQ